MNVWLVKMDLEKVVKILMIRKFVILVEKDKSWLDRHAKLARKTALFAQTPTLVCSVTLNFISMLQIHVYSVPVQRLIFSVKRRKCVKNANFSIRRIWNCKVWRSPTSVSGSIWRLTHFRSSIFRKIAKKVVLFSKSDRKYLNKEGL